jgi:phosphate starvation-inducible protein PhoH
MGLEAKPCDDRLARFVGELLAVEMRVERVEHLDGDRQRAAAPRVMIRTRKKTIVPRSAMQTPYMEALASSNQPTSAWASP